MVAGPRSAFADLADCKVSSDPRACESTYMDCLKLGGLMYSPCKLPMEGARINAPVLPV